MLCFLQAPARFALRVGHEQLTQDRCVVACFLPKMLVVLDEPRALSFAIVVGYSSEHVGALLEESRLGTRRRSVAGEP